MARKNENSISNANSPHIPESIKSDGIDVEFSPELADQDDLEAQARSDAADARAHNQNK